MADVSAVDGGRESRSGGVARDRAGAGTFSWFGLILTVVGTNIALGAFLWLVTDARFNSMESRLSNIESVLTSGAGSAPSGMDYDGIPLRSGCSCQVSAIDEIGRV